MKVFLLAIGLAAQLAMISPAQAQITTSTSSSSTTGGYSGPCEFSAQPDICIPPASPTAVPEPDIVLLLAGAAGAIAASRRRRRQHHCP